jgi:Flp pilus assembly protein TadG
MVDLQEVRDAMPSSGVRVVARSRDKLALARGERGSALVEFAVVISLMMIILMGIVSFGIAFNNQITLTNAVNNAAQALMAGSGVITDPCQSANNALAQAAANLNNSSIYGSNPLSFSISAYTTTTTPNTVGPYNVVFSGTGGPSCTGEAANLTAGQEVVVTATYGCNLQVFGFNYAPNCKLSAQAAEAVQ